MSCAHCPQGFAAFCGSREDEGLLGVYAEYVDLFRFSVQACLRDVSGSGRCMPLDSDVGIGEVGQRAGGHGDCLEPVGGVADDSVVQGFARGRRGLDVFGDDCSGGVAGADCVRRRSLAGGDGDLFRGSGVSCKEGGGDASTSGVGSSVLRGRHYERNRRKKDLRRAAKNRGSAGGSLDQSGFWNSCSGSVRRDLIDSKARMHIAENEKREAEARARINYVASPEALVRRVVGLQAFAERQVTSVVDERIGGWARTVASAGAENLARSAPSSVPSFDGVVRELDSRSASQVDAELSALRHRIGELEGSMSSQATLVDEKNAEIARKDAELKVVRARVSGGDDGALKGVKIGGFTQVGSSAKLVAVNAKIAALEADLLKKKQENCDLASKLVRVRASGGSSDVVTGDHSFRGSGGMGLNRVIGFTR